MDMIQTIQLFYQKTDILQNQQLNIIIKLIFHNGVREALNQTRLKFWVKKPRNYISRNIKKCIICNHHEGNPFQYPAPPYLPLYRLNDKFSFTYRAVDYAGPLYINNIYSKLQTFKCQIVLFTCASNRCVYLDLVPDCCSSSQICVLKKFFCRWRCTNVDYQ